MSELNAALVDPKAATDDETLFAVLLLGFYESLTCDASKGSQSWQAHVHGATEMLRLRGLEAAKTPIGAALFYELRPSIAIDCVWHSRPMPRFIREWPKHLDGHKVPGLVAIDQLFDCVFALADFRAAIADSTTTDHELYSRGALIETAMVEWSQQVSTNPKWCFSAVPGSEYDQCNDAGIKVAHQYHSPRELGAWNMQVTVACVDEVALTF